MKRVLLITILTALLYPCFLSGLDQKAATEVQKALVIAEKAEIFLEASQHSIVIDSIPRGTTVTLFQSGKKNNKWLYISYFSEKRSSQVTGFIDRNRVEIIPQAKEDEEIQTQEAEPEKTLSQKQEEKTQESIEQVLEEIMLQQIGETEKEQNQMTEKSMETQTEEKQKTTETEQHPKQETKEEADIKDKTTQKPQVIKEAMLQQTEETQKEQSQVTEKSAETQTEEKQEAAETEQHPKKETMEEADIKDKTAVEEPQEAAVEELPKVLTKVSIKVPRANIRLMPTTKSSIISQVLSGVALKTLAKTGNWYRVNLPPNKEGLVFSGYIHHSIVNEIYETVVPPPQEPEKIPDKESEIVEEEAEPEPEEILEIPPQRKSSIGKDFWMGGGAGYTMPSESHFGKGLNIGGTLGFGVMKHLAVELRVPYSHSDVNGTAGGLSSGRLSSLSLMLSVQARYPIKNRYVPYLVAGGDYHLNNFSLNEEITNSWNNLGFNIEESVDHAFGFHFGAGLDYFLLENVALNLDVRYYTANLTGKRILSDQTGKEITSTPIGSMKLNSLQAGISVKLFLIR